MEEKTKIMVVDDEERNLRLMEALLVPLGHEVILVGDGPQALKTAEEKGVKDWKTLSAQGTLAAKRGDHALEDLGRAAAVERPVDRLLGPRAILGQAAQHQQLG